MTADVVILSFTCIRGGGVLHEIFCTYVKHAKKMDRSDLSFYENEGSKRFKINEKGGQLDRKLKEY